MPHGQVQDRWPFWLGWILASAAGGAVTGYLEWVRFQFLATLVLQGFLVGLAQGWVLRRQVDRGWLWVPATGVGMLAGYLLWSALPHAGVIDWLHTTLGL